MEPVDKAEMFLREKYEADILKAKDGFVNVSFSDLDRYDPVLSDMLLEEPIQTIPVFKEAAARISDERLNVRFKDLPESRGTTIRNLRSKHLGKLLLVDTTIKSATEVKPQIYEVIFECPDCSEHISVTQESKVVKGPGVCECGRRGNFPVVKKKMHDVRWLTGIDPYEVIEGERPGEIAVYLEEDLTTPKMQRKTDPGSRMKIVGILKELPKRIRGKLSTKMDMYLEAIYMEPSEIEFEDLEITEEDEQRIKDLASDPEIYEKLKASIAPGLYGFDEIKEAVLLQMFGGVPHVLPDGNRIRGNLHILLTGDPGVGKTMMLKLTSGMAPRGRYVSGSGVTGAGLCTTYDTLVVLGNGEMRKIGDIVEEKNGELEKESDGIFTAEAGDIEIMSLDQEDMKIKPMKVTKYWKLKAPGEMVKLTTRSGKEIKLTKNNPVPVIENGKIVWKNAESLENGDYVATPRTLKPVNSETPLTDVIDKTARLVNCGQTVSAMLREVRKTSSIKDFISKTNLSPQGVYWNWKNEARAPKISNLDTMSRHSGMDLHDLMPDDMVLTQLNGNYIKMPKTLNKEIMYFFGLIAGDGDIAETKYGGLSLRFHNSSKELLDRFRSICREQFDIEPEFYKHPERMGYCRINSKIIGGIANLLGIPSGKKPPNLEVTEYLSGLPDSLVAPYIRGVFDTDGYACKRKTKGASYIGLTTASRKFADGMSLLLLRFGILSKVRERKASVSEIRGRKIISGKKYEVEIKGLPNIKAFRQEIGFGLLRKKERLNKIIIGSMGRENTNTDLVPSTGNLLRQARLSCGMTAKELYGYKNYTYEKNRRRISRNMLKKVAAKFTADNEYVRRLRVLASSDIFWDEIVGVEKIDAPEWVYDLTVEKEHSFVANGMIIHNTASVRKNETLGTWVLEAGALILANKSVIGIDEFDKINKDDQIALHEAMSIESVSIAKASIVATLPAQTAVLAGANPKYGRFDPFKPILEQITIPETLLSRFDLKFALRDVPDKDRDTELAEHITKSRREPEKVEPLIKPDKLRKYIAYAKNKIREIELTEEAANTLRDFYIDMRTRDSSEETPAVSITLRQYEALLRMAEASAKIRLSRKAEKSDADRAIRLMTYSLYQLGYDYETGRIDVDRIESGVTASKRRKISLIMEIIESLQEESREVAIEDIKAEAENQGIERVDEIVEKLLREGTIFTPRAGFVRKV